MYVSMNPKGETGKVIHISQNDTNREVEFIPFDQKGLTPLTDGQLTAKINSIKGNTVSFNQLIDPNDFGVVVQAGYTWTKTNGSINITGTSNSNGIYRFSNLSKLITGHKYFMKGCPANGSSSTWYLRLTGQNIYDYGSGAIFQFTELPSSSEYIRAYVTSSSDPINITFTPQFHDLTLMGIDNLTTTAEVEAWLSSHIGNLPYYDYTQGTLISFNGTGLKTTSTNLLSNQTWIQGSISGTGTDNNSPQRIKTDGFVDIPQGKTYTISIQKGLISLRFYDNNGTFKEMKPNSPTKEYTFDLATDRKIRIVVQKEDGNENIVPSEIDDMEINLYETSNTLSLPTSTYFPTGIKVVPDYANGGDIADELTPSKAITRIGSVDLGSLEWTKSAASFRTNIPSDCKKPLNNGSIINSMTTANMIMKSVGSASGTAGSFEAFITQAGELYWYYPLDGIADGQAFATLISGQYLYYELATYTETDISLDLTYPVWNGGTEQILPINDSTPDTAPIKANITYPDRTEDTEFLYKQTSFVFIPRTWAFVCKNITQALTLVGNVLKGTIPGTMTSESGKFPLKVKMTDNDGVCFSEKIDLFVERKP